MRGPMLTKKGTEWLLLLATAALFTSMVLVGSGCVIQPREPAMHVFELPSGRMAECVGFDYNMECWTLPVEEKPE